MNNYKNTVPSPKQRIKQFVESMYPNRRVDVSGHRMRASKKGEKYPLFLTTVRLGGKLLVSAAERNWRMAYKTLQINLNKELVP